MSELLYIKWRNKTVTRREYAWSSFLPPSLSSNALLCWPFAAGSGLSMFKQRGVKVPATTTTKTTITTTRRIRTRNMQQREATKSKLKYFKTPFYDNFAWYPSESFGTPTRPLLITVLSAHCRPAGCLAGHVLPTPTSASFSPFPHFLFLISVFAAFLVFSSRSRYGVFAVPLRENLKCTRCEFKAISRY